MEISQAEIKSIYFCPDCTAEILQTEYSRKILYFPTEQNTNGNRKEGHSIIASDSLIEKILTGEFEENKRNTNRDHLKFRQEFTKFIGPGKHAANLAYYFLVSYPRYFPDEKFSSSRFKPSSLEELPEMYILKPRSLLNSLQTSESSEYSSKKNKKSLLSKEDEQKAFTALNYHRMLLNLSAKKLLSIPTKKLNKELVFTTIKEYNYAQEFSNYLIKANIGLVYSLAKRYVKQKFFEYDLDELVSFSLSSLYSAINCFDYRKNFKFSSYATKAILLNLNRNISSSLKEKKFEEKSNLEHLSYVPQLFSCLDDRMLLLRKIIQGQTPNPLTDKERAILRMVYGFEETVMSLAQVGKRMNLSRQRISQINKEAIRKLKISLIKKEN